MFQLITSKEQFKQVYKVQNRQSKFILEDILGYISNVKQSNETTIYVKELLEFLLYAKEGEIKIGRYRARPKLTEIEVEEFKKKQQKNNNFVVEWTSEQDGEKRYALANRILQEE